HRGVDWQPLTVVTRAPAGTTDLSGVDPGLFTENSGSLSAPNQSSTYSFTVSSALGDGELTAEVTAGGGLLPRLTLSDAHGAVLIQSDSGRLVQSLQPGTYLVTISARSGTGSYRLDTGFVRTAQPFAPLATGEGAASVAVTEVNGDGVPDVI